jgi:hypothetical protein
MRYLTAAFWSRPQIPILRWFPWNAFLVAGAAVGGYVIDPMIWLTAGAFETLYLATLATNPHFQRWVDTSRGIPLPEPEVNRKKLLRELGGKSRQRYVKLEEKVKRIEKLAEVDDVLFESNHIALEKLLLLYLRLLGMEKNLSLLKSADADDLRDEIEEIEEEMHDPQLARSVRETKQITLNLLTQRLRNIERRDESLREVDSDLARIEAQIDLAVEEASLKTHPVSISGNVRLVSQLLDSGSGIRDSGFGEPESPIPNPESRGAERQ